ncbi:MAG TPA: hypothetical protein VHB79_08540 [Polyangiaceae bacterium]|nr:hypothetical protein [Polyangiaceae bacterium]
MTPRLAVNFPLLSSLALLLACSAGGTGSGSTNSQQQNQNTGATSTNPDMPHLNTGGTSGSGSLNIAGSDTVGKDPNDPRDVPVRQKMCDANGENCTCLRLALLGTLDSAANNKDTQPFIDWLNAKSGGTATVTMVNTKPTLNADWLANYDVLLVANVNGWAFSADEKAAVQTWSHDMGGGIISLTGFVSTASEPADTSQLISFSGMSYTATRTAENGQSKPVYYKGGTVDLKECLAWTGGSDAIITAPIKFTPQTGSMEKLTLSLDYVGAFIGFGVTAPAGATTVATDPVSGQPMAVAMEVEGRGRVLAFGDEWVIFKNQWEPTGNPNNMQMDQYNKCWQPASGTDPGFFQSVKTLYQTKQFWYDAINWVAPPNQCNFVVEDPDVVVK